MISIDLDNNSNKSLYIQLYEYLKTEMLEGRIKSGDKLPSLRNMSQTLGISITTVKTAYDQLLVEGYLINKPNSGFYAADVRGKTGFEAFGSNRSRTSLDSSGVGQTGMNAAPGPAALSGHSGPMFGNDTGAFGPQSVSRSSKSGIGAEAETFRAGTRNGFISGSGVGDKSFGSGSGSNFAVGSGTAAFDSGSRLESGAAAVDAGSRSGLGSGSGVGAFGAGLRIGSGSGFGPETGSAAFDSGSRLESGAAAVDAGSRSGLGPGSGAGAFGTGLRIGSGSGFGPETGSAAVDAGSRSGLGPGSGAGTFMAGGSAGLGDLYFDPESFDLIKWKKCMSAVISESSELLFSEADPQGESVLRNEVAGYLYRSRGVSCGPDQIVISAGTQQLINHLARVLKMIGIGLVCTEDPGYLPVRNSFRDWGFSISDIPVKEDGLMIERLPINVRTAVYVCPQNQFPTGSIMPIGRRQQLLSWAADNDSIIIEDDYNSELRYFGMPVPALQGLDKSDRVVYLGSFSSTLFPAVRISYMVLPPHMAALYETIKKGYDQTCSKTEQLTLAMFMQKGYYQSNLRKIRKLYSRKLETVLKVIKECDSSGSFITAENSESGITLMLKISTRARVLSEGTGGSDRIHELTRVMVRRLVKAAAGCHIRIKGVDQLSDDGQIHLILYYNQIPMDRIRTSVSDMIAALKATVCKGTTDMPSVYEVVRIQNKQPVFLREHYERLEVSLGSLGIEVPFSCADLAECIDSMVRDNAITNHNLKLECDISGYSVLYMIPTHYPGAELYEQGIRTDILYGERRNPNIKMMDQELRDKADRAIREKNVYEVLLADRHGNITEGSRSNVFFIKGGEVITPPAGNVLKGITRMKILEIIKEMEDSGVVLSERTVGVKELDSFDAAFISGTSPGILPIASIGKRTYNVNAPLLRELMQRWKDGNSPQVV